MQQRQNIPSQDCRLRVSCFNQLHHKTQWGCQSRGDGTSTAGRVRERLQPIKLWVIPVNLVMTVFIVHVEALACGQSRARGARIPGFVSGSATDSQWDLVQVPFSLGGGGGAGVAIRV